MNVINVIKKINRQQIIKDSTHKLITGSLAAKIPEWNDMLRFVDIRNCIVHSQNYLDNKTRDELIRNYSKKTQGLTIIEKKNPFNEMQTQKIILEKEFCHNALKTVEFFRGRLHFILSELDAGRI